MRSRIFITLLLLALAPAAGARAQINDAGEAIERGNGFFNRGQYNLAIFEYREALNWPGGHQARARFNIGVCEHRRGRLREATAEYREAIKLREGRYPSASYALGVALQDLRRYEEAREAFAQAVESSGGKHAEALFALALESQRAGDDHAAFELYRRAVAQSKDNIPACHNNLGVILARAGLFDEAEREFEAAVRISRGKFAEASQNLSRLRRMLGGSPPSMIAGLKTVEGAPGIMVKTE
ncbi:MAG TPA: tetratricopeptide repeat protein [Blastocatellia bacterium]